MKPRIAPPVGKYILDACCGSRMFWFDRENPAVLFCDIRSEEHTLCDGRSLSVKPDMIVDFRDMPFVDNSFRMVVFDPPHFKSLGRDSWTAKKYGVLLPTWETDIRAGFDECMRVLAPMGTLIFKWNATQIPVERILDAIRQRPLIGHKSGKNSNTHWLTFLKQP